MKKFRILSLLLALTGMVFVSSCVKDDDPVGMDPSKVDVSLLVGKKWKSDSNPDWYKKYTTTASPSVLDGSYKYGSDWTIGETTEDQEGTEFYYKVEGNQIKEQYPTMSIYTPRIYTIKTLTATKLEYFDSYDVFSFTKQ